MSLVSDIIEQIMNIDNPNNLVTVIEILKTGAYLVIHNSNSKYNSYGRFFHKVCQDIPEDSKKKWIDDNFVVYLEVGEIWRSLLDDGEWEYYIKESGFKECSCNMRYVVDNPSNVKHKVHLEIKN